MKLNFKQFTALYVSVFFLSIGCMPFGYAETDEEIIVTATRIPMDMSDVLVSTAVITERDIERLQPKDLPSLLGRVSGVSFRDSGGRGTTSSVFVRGTASGQTLVLIDGVRVESATTGTASLGSIPVESIERIEVVKGPVSGLYGADAMGGVIQIFTKKGQASGGGSLKIAADTQNTVESSLLLQGGATQAQYALTLNTEKQDGFDRMDLDTNGNDDEDVYEEVSGSLSLDFELNEQLSASLYYLKSDNRVEFDSVSARGDNRFTDNEIENVSSQLIYQPLDAFKLTVSAGKFMDESTTEPTNSVFDTERSSFSVQADNELTDDLLVSLGVDYYNDEVDSGSTNYVETERDNVGTFAQAQYYFGQVSTIANLRYDENERYGDDLNGFLAMGYQLSDAIKFTVSYGTAFQAPTFNQLYFPGSGDPNLEPQESESYEVSLSGFVDIVDWRISTYKTDIANQIIFSPNEEGVYVATSVDGVDLQGIELEFKADIDDVFARFNLDYLEARDKRTDEFLENRPTLVANVDLGYQLDRLYLGVDIHGEHGRRDRDQKLGGFVLVGLNGEYSIAPEFSVYGQLSNIFDQDYTLNLASDTVAYRTYGTTAEMGFEYRF